MNRPGRGQRQIIKQGYLKKVSNSRKLTRPLKRPERRWVVFGILGGHEPYLEYYSSEEGVFTSPPLTYISLLTCKHVSHVFISSKYNNNFTIITDERVVDFIAPTRNVMLEWCSTIERKLKSLHILTDSKENDYEISRIPRRQNPVESVIQVSRDYSQPLDSQDTETPRTATPSSIPTSPAPLPPESADAGAVFFGDSSSLPSSPAPVPPSDAPEQVFFSEADLNQPPVVPPRPSTSFSSPHTSEESLTQTSTPPPPPRSSAGSSARSSGTSSDRPRSSEEVFAQLTPKLEATEALRRPGRDPKSPLPPPPLGAKRNRRPPPPLPVQRPLSSPVIPPLPPIPADRPVTYPESSSTLSRIDDLRKRPLPPPPLPEKSETIRRRSQLLLRSESWESSSDSSPRGSSVFGPARDSYSSEDSSDHVEVSHLLTSDNKPIGPPARPSTLAENPAADKRPQVTYATVNHKNTEPLNKTADITHAGKSPEDQKSKQPPLIRPIPAPRTKKSPPTSLIPTPSDDACQTHNLPQNRNLPSASIPQKEEEPAEPIQREREESSKKSDAPELKRDQSGLHAIHTSDSDDPSLSEELYETPKTVVTESEQNLVIPTPSLFTTEASDKLNSHSSNTTSTTFTSNSKLTLTDPTRTTTSTSETVSSVVPISEIENSTTVVNSKSKNESDLNKADDVLIDFDVNDNQLKITMQQEDTYQSLWNGASPISTARPAGRAATSSAPNAIAPPPIVPRRLTQPHSPGSENGTGPGFVGGASRDLTVVTGRARPAGDEPVRVNGLQYGARVPVGQPVFLCDEDEEENGEVAAASSNQLQARLRGFNRTNTTPSPPPSEPIAPLMAPVYPQAPDGARGATGGATYLPRPEVVRENSNMSVIPPKMMEAMGLDDPVVGGWNQPPGEEGAPPPYLPRSVLERGTSKSLKESQVELLQKEMNHPGGVRVMLRRIDCHHTLALLDCCNGVWIGGWNQEARPFLHNAFHVGDKVISINGQVVENVKMANKLIKHCSNEDKITFILHRLPHGRVFAIKREEDGQSLGIRRIAGTNEIEDIEPYGLAAKHEIPAKAPTRDGTNLCNWWITEVNNRPVSLFYKNNEVEHRLNAVGKDITVLIQPTDLVQEFRAQLKLIKNYKDFVVQ